MTASNEFIDRLRQRAEAEIARIAAFCEGQVGVAARHLGNGLEVRVGDAALYPPASTVKVPLALALLDRVDRGELQLAEMVEVREEEMNPVGPVGDEFPHPGVSLSVANLLEPMITRSCNTATDVLLRVIGGPAAVGDYLRRIGVEEFQFERTMRVALAVMHEMPLPPAHVSFREALSGQPQEVLDARNRSHAQFHHERRDMASPRAMLQLLVRLWQGQLLAPRSRQLLIDMMGRSSTGADRIRGRLPQGTSFASKSGSGTGTAVEAGYLRLPEDLGTVALGVFVMSSPRPMADRERVMADIGRLLHDYFLLAGAAA